MTLISLILSIVLVGVLLWLVNTYIPMQPSIRRVLNIVVLIVVILWLLRLFGLLDGLGGIRVVG